MVTVCVYVCACLIEIENKTVRAESVVQDCCTGTGSGGAYKC
jgi:hypothetical protein